MTARRTYDIMDLMEGENDTMFVFAESDKVIQNKESPISIITCQTSQKT